MKRKKYLIPQDQVFLPFLLRNKLSKMMNEGDLSVKQKNKLIDAARAFHLEALEYALDNFPIEDEFLCHARFLNFTDQKCSFSSCLWLANHLKSYIQFTPMQFSEMEEEFVQLAGVDLDIFPPSVLEEATIRVDKEDDSKKVYRIDVLWWFLHELKLPGTSISRFKHLFKLAKVVLTVVHSNAVEESLFSRVRKNLTAYRSSLSLDGSLSSIITFQMNREDGEQCFEYSPSNDVLDKAKKVTWEYNKEHSKQHQSKEK